MSSNEWDQIQHELGELHEKEESEFLRMVLEDLRNKASAKPLLPESFRAAISAIRRISVEVEGGKPIDEVLDKATTEEQGEKGAQYFYNPDWNPEVVNQARTVVNVTVNKVRQEMDEAPDPKIEIPVLLLVMDAKQAKLLSEGKVFEPYKGEPYADQFTSLRNILDQSDGGWIKRYKARPKDWQPFRGSNDTIEDLITQALNNMVEYHGKLAPRFDAINDLTKESNRKTLRELRRRGCIVVMDAVSMQHPDIQQIYRRALLDAYPSIFIVRVEPVDNALDVEQQMIRFTEKYVDLEFYKRLNFDYDDDGCTQAYRALELRKWIIRQVRNLIPEDERPQSGIRKYRDKGRD
jgi:hypothetical protein